MANPFFSSATRYPLTQRPLTSPDVKNTHQDLFNMIRTFNSMLRDMDSLFIGSTITTPPDEDAAWVNVGTGGTTFQDSSEQSIRATGAASGTNLVIRVRPLIQPTPYKFTVLLNSQFSTKGKLGTGICLRLASSGALITFGVREGSLEVCTYTSLTTAPTVLVSVPLTQSVNQWYRIDNDGTNFKFKFCADGESWITLHTLATSSRDQAGFWVSTENTATPNLDIVARLFSWRVEPL